MIINIFSTYYFITNNKKKPLVMFTKLQSITFFSITEYSGKHKMKKFLVT